MSGENKQNKTKPTNWNPNVFIGNFLSRKGLSTGNWVLIKYYIIIIEDVGNIGNWKEGEKSLSFTTQRQSLFNHCLNFPVLCRFIFKVYLFF